MIIKLHTKDSIKNLDKVILQDLKSIFNDSDSEATEKLKLKLIPNIKKDILKLWLFLKKETQKSILSMIPKDWDDFYEDVKKI